MNVGACIAQPPRKKRKVYCQGVPVDVFWIQKRDRVEQVTELERFEGGRETFLTRYPTTNGGDIFAEIIILINIYSPDRVTMR